MNSLTLRVLNDSDGLPRFDQSGTRGPVFDTLIDRFDLHYLARKYWKRLLILPTLCAALALTLALLQQPLYESTSVILVDPSYDKIIQFENVDSGNRSDMEALKSLEIAIVSDSVLLRVLHRMNLLDDPGFLPKDLAKEGVSEVKILNYLREKRIETSLLPETRLIRIRVYDPVPERARDIAAALSSEFEVYLAEQRRDEVRQVRQSLEKQAEMARQVALDSEKALRGFRETHPEFPVEQDHDFFSSRLTQLGQQLNDASGMRMELESQAKALEELDPTESPIEIIKVAGYNDMPHVSVLLDSLAANRAELSAIENAYTPQHPTYQAAKAKVDRTEAELQELAKRIQAAISADFLKQKNREELLRNEVETAKSSLVESKSLSSEFRALLQQSERDWATHQALQNKISESAVATELTSQIATLVSEPMVPYKRAKPSLLLYLVIGVMLGGLIASGGIVGSVIAGLPFSDSNQLRQHSGLPVIADWSESKKVPNPQQSTALLQYLGGNRDKTIQISAPSLNGIGESVAQKVALLAAENGRRTLLILIKSDDNDDCRIHPAGHANLFTMKVPADLVRKHERFQMGLEQLKNDFDNIFVEAGSSEDPELVDLLSVYSDQDVVVVGKGKSRKQVVEDRIHRLTRSSHKPIALMMVDSI